jgi:hypothetical protein
MDDRFVAVRALADSHKAARFPDCKGEEIDGVDLVLVDLDLHGCVQHFLGEPFAEDDWQADILRRVTADLDRIAPLLPSDCSDYFGGARELAHALLSGLDRPA